MTVKTNWIGGEFPSLIPKRRYSKVKKLIVVGTKPLIFKKNGIWHAKVNKRPITGSDEHKAYRMACKHALKLNLLENGK
jgi:hypothetical protein